MTDRVVIIGAMAVMAACSGEAAKEKARCSDEGVAGLPECKRRCDKGDVAACRETGDLMWDGETSGALGYYGRACDAGDDLACDRLAWAHLEGRGTKVDLGRAMELAEPRCARGRGDSCALLVEVARSAGIDASSQRERAVAAYRKECDAGRGAAGRGSCWTLAARGWLPLDEAVTYAKRACDRGEENALCKDDRKLREFLQRGGSR